VTSEPLSATWRLVTEPLRARPGAVPDGEGAARAHRRLAQLDDVVFDGIVAQLASREEGAHLRSLLAPREAAAASTLEARIAAVCSKKTKRLVASARSLKPEA